jgi:hypothetical protein
VEGWEAEGWEAADSAGAGWPEAAGWPAGADSEAAGSAAEAAGPAWSGTATAARASLDRATECRSRAGRAATVAVVA